MIANVQFNTSFSYLPDELVSHVVSFVKDERTLYAVLKVCSKWKKLCEDRNCEAWHFLYWKIWDKKLILRVNETPHQVFTRRFKIIGFDQMSDELGRQVKSITEAIQQIRQGRFSKNHSKKNSFILRKTALYRHAKSYERRFEKAYKEGKYCKARFIAEELRLFLTKANRNKELIQIQNKMVRLTVAYTNPASKKMAYLFWRCLTTPSEMKKNFQTSESLWPYFQSSVEGNFRTLLTVCLELNPTILNEKGSYLLGLAAHYQNYDIMSFLLEYNPSIDWNKKYGPLKQTPLHEMSSKKTIVSWDKWEKIAQQLIQHMSFSKARNRLDQTPLDLAFQTRNEKIINFLQRYFEIA